MSQLHASVAAPPRPAPHSPYYKGFHLMIAIIDLLTAARAEALFVSALPIGFKVTSEEIADVTRHAVQTYGGSRGCAAEAIARYYEYPESSVPRMRWAVDAVQRAYGTGRTRVRFTALRAHRRPRNA